MKKIQMVDLISQNAKIRTQIDEGIARVIDSSRYIGGPEVIGFQNELSDYLGGAKVVACANGTDALQVAMMALDFQPGDEIILPTFTYVATAEVVALLRLKPVLVDVDADSFNVSVKEIEKAITPKTKAIVPVHLFGQCANMEAIMQLANQHNLYVIEDAAQAIGSDYTFSDGKKMKAGTIGTIGTTSFFPSKNLGCFGDGGAIFTPDETLAEKIRMTANHGQAKKYYFDKVGVNSRLDPLQASILRIKLQHLDEYAQARRNAANYYDEHLKNHPKIKIPSRNPQSSHVFHQYTVQLDESIDRNKLQADLKTKEIPSMVYYPVPLHFQKAYEHLNDKPYPVSEKLSNCVISLPMHTELQKEQQDYILNNFLSLI